MYAFMPHTSKQKSLPTKEEKDGTGETPPRQKRDVRDEALPLKQEAQEYWTAKILGRTHGAPGTLLGTSYASHLLNNPRGEDGLKF